MVNLGTACSFKALSRLEIKNNVIYRKVKCKTKVTLIVAVTFWFCFCACLDFPIRNTNIILKGIGPFFSLQSNHPFDCNSRNRKTLMIKSFQNCNYKYQSKGTTQRNRAVPVTRTTREKQRFCRTNGQQTQQVRNISTNNSAGELTLVVLIFECSRRHRLCFRHTDHWSHCSAQ